MQLDKAKQDEGDVVCSNSTWKPFQLMSSVNSTAESFRDHLDAIKSFEDANLNSWVQCNIVNNTNIDQEIKCLIVKTLDEEFGRDINVDFPTCSYFI